MESHQISNISNDYFAQHELYPFWLVVFHSFKSGFPVLAMNLGLYTFPLNSKFWSVLLVPPDDIKLLVDKTLLLCRNIGSSPRNSFVSLSTFHLAT